MCPNTNPLFSAALSAGTACGCVTCGGTTGVACFGSLERPGDTACGAFAEPFGCVLLQALPICVSTNVFLKRAVTYLAKHGREGLQRTSSCEITTGTRVC